MPRNGNKKNGSPCDPVALEAKAAVKRPINKLFGEIARVISREVGRAWVFVVAVISIVIWGLSGPLFGFSDTWQLVINTGTTIVTFLMVFLIQRAQNKEGRVIHGKSHSIEEAESRHSWKRSAASPRPVKKASE